MPEPSALIFNETSLPATLGLNSVEILREIHSEYLLTLSDLLQQLDQPDLARQHIVNAVHKLKSSSASVGALALSEVLDSLDQRLRAGDDPLDHIRQARLVGQQTLTAIGSYLDAL